MAILTHPVDIALVQAKIDAALPPNTVTCNGQALAATRARLLNLLVGVGHSTHPNIEQADVFLLKMYNLR